MRNQGSVLSLAVVFSSGLALAESTKPSVHFLEPKDHAVVGQTFKAKFEVTGMKLEAAGPIKPNSGHHHIIINAGPSAKGHIIPKDEMNLHFGKAESEAEIKLAPGKYTLTLQFADGAHKSLGSEMSQTISITVK